MMNNKIKKLYVAAGFSDDIEGKWPNIFSVGTPLELLVKLVVEECAIAAELHARSYSDGDAGTGATASANAVRAYGHNLLNG